jgi:hypothetical protein
MTAFIIRSGVSMILMFLIYWLILRKEKLFNFNRYYLIFSVLFSLTVPFISIPANIGTKKVVKEIATVLNHKFELNFLEHEVKIAGQESSLSGTTERYTVDQYPAKKSAEVDRKKIYLLIYILGLMLMSGRFLRNILHVLRLFKRSEIINHEYYDIALLENHINPFSFLHTIYLNKQEYLQNRIADDVFKHEFEHVRQLHSFDVIFFEIIHIIFWFNPILFLYKRAARINHEYLADEAVISDSLDIETYACELINFVKRRVSVPFTSGFNPSMIRKRLLMLNTTTTVRCKNIRMGIALFMSVFFTTVLSIKPVYPEIQGDSNKKQIAENDDIVIDEVYFRSQDFKPLKALFVLDGKTLDINDTIRVNPQQIKTFDLLKGRNAIRKYGRLAKNGAVEISTYKSDISSLPDSLYFKPIYTVNNRVPEGSITMPVSNLYSLSIWTYPINPKQDRRKRWRTIDIVTRDHYRISGKVIQDNGEPLPGALVTVTDNPSETITDKNGRFLLEDVKTNAVAEVYADGYKSLYFNVKGRVFTTDLTITLDTKDEAVQNMKWTNHYIKDFSGIWKYSKELSDTRFPVIKYVIDIRQYNSDSIEMKISRAFENYRELDSKSSFVFNSIKTEDSGMFDNTKSTLTCSIGSDGQSFSVTYDVKSKLGLFNEDKRGDIYTLSDDGKYLIVSTVDFPDVSSTSGKEILKVVFDKN